MLKQLLQIFKEEDPIKDMIEEFLLMLDKGKDMFLLVTDLLFLGGDVKGEREEIYSTDQAMNYHEQNIRRKIVVHLSLRPSDNLSASLILMSIVKDAERIGDYAKNIYEVCTTVAPLQSGMPLKKTMEFRNYILGAFDRVKTSFSQSDVESARKQLREFSKQEKEIDQLVAEILKNQSQENSVAFALLLRFFKRILSHLKNITTSVIMPVDKLDYFDEDHRVRI